MHDRKVEVQRALWRSRRGLLELDLLLLPFARACYADLGPADRAAYRALLDCEDTDIWTWLQRRDEPDEPALRRIVALILVHNQAEHGAAQ